MSGIRRHLTFAIVISLTALFAALGGGAWAVIQGGGSVRSGTVKGPPTNPVRLLSVDGTGLLTIACPNPGLGELELLFKNTTTKRERVLIRDSSSTDSEQVTPGGQLAFLKNQQDQLTFHFWQASGADRPQAVVTVSLLPEPSCAKSFAAAEATATSR